jgi:uncharacterized protein (TIGR02118 family)
MIKVSVFYPNEEGKKFDMEYYLKKHMPMVNEKSAGACRRMEIDQGLAGGAPGSPPAYAAIGHLYFDSVEAFQTAIMPHMGEIAADIPNYTNIQPLIQISDLKM